jgi:hypothetical protein
MLALFAQETEGETQLRGRNYRITERKLYHEKEKRRNAIEHSRAHAVASVLNSATRLAHLQSNQ